MLVTKAVSDQIGSGGIADQMIRFNGFPFLEKEDAESGDKTFIEPISHIMKKDVVTIPATGLSLHQLGELVQSTSYQGFPLVRSPTDLTIMGFIRKNDLRYALERARRTYKLAHDAQCTFYEMVDASGDDSGLLPQPDIVVPRPPSRGGPNPYGESDEIHRLDFGQYVDEIPLTVPPKMPLEIVLQLFRRMGPRVILVSLEGKLAGLVTIKDVLRHEASEKVREAAVALSHSRAQSWDADWAPIPGDDNLARPASRRGAPILEGLLEDGLVWAQTRGVGVVNDVIARVRPVRPGGARPDEQYSFEMSGDSEERGERDPNREQA